MSMDKYTNIINDVQFSKLTLDVTQYPKALGHWEKLLNFLLNKAAPINKTIPPNVLGLITSTFDSMLFNFPYLENYHIDYALFEYKLGNISRFHQIFKRALTIFNHRSLVLWVSYLRICNEIVIDTKQLFKKYEMAEASIGLHYHSGLFWEMYLNQLTLRCKTKQRYYIVLRKSLEVPMHAFSKFYAIWLRHIDEIRDFSELPLIVSKEDLSNKLQIDLNFGGRRGPHLKEAKKTIKRYTKELYMAVQAQVIEMYNLYESSISTQFYTSPDTIIPSDEVDTWLEYTDYIATLDISPLCHLTFQRALTTLASLDIIWIKYANWLMDIEDNYSFAKNILISGLNMSIRKSHILKHLYSVLMKLDDLDSLESILETVNLSFQNNIESSEDFELFWDYIQFQIILHNSTAKSRYEGKTEAALLPDTILTKIQYRIRNASDRKERDALLNGILSLQSKENTKVIERDIFQSIIDSTLSDYTNEDIFWNKYSKLIFFDVGMTYLEKRKYIVTKIWPQIPENLVSYEAVKEFALEYLPEDIGTLSK